MSLGSFSAPENEQKKIELLSFEQKGRKKCHRMIRDGIFKSISFKDVSCIDFLDDIIQGCIVAVGDDGIGQFLEFIEIVHNP